MSAPLAISKLSAVPLSAPAALALGSQVEAFTVLKVLAEGRHGFVYLARHAVHGTTCVLKEFMPRLHAMRLGDGSVSPRHAGDAIAMSVARIEFMKEATTLAGIDQPGLVRVLGLVEANRTLYRVMPLYDGSTLQQHCRQRNAAPSLAWLAVVVDDLLHALEPVHARGRAHGRVQPNQVLVSSSQRATLLGFGSVARELDDPPTDPWRAPEASGAHRHLRPEPAGDLYALAATAWFAATGVAPPTTAERRADPPRGAREQLAGLGDREDDPPHLRRGLIQALDAGMAAASGSRPQTVAEFRRLLQGESSLQVLPFTMAPRWVGAEISPPGHDGPPQSPLPAPPRLADAASAAASSAAAAVEPTLRVVAASATIGLAEAAPVATDHAVIGPAEIRLGDTEPAAMPRTASALAGLVPGLDAPIEALPAPTAQVGAMGGGVAANDPPAIASVLATAAPLSAAPSDAMPMSIAIADAGVAAMAPVPGSEVAAVLTQMAPFELAPAAVLRTSAAAPQSTLADAPVVRADPDTAPDAASMFAAVAPVEALLAESVPVWTAAAEARVDAEPLAAEPDVAPAAAAEAATAAAEGAPDDAAPAEAVPVLTRPAETPAAAEQAVAASVQREPALTQTVPGAAMPSEVAHSEPAPGSTATATSVLADVEVDGAATAVAAQVPGVVTEATPGEAHGVETAHVATVSAEDARAEAGGVVTLSAAAAFVVIAPDQAAPPSRETARPTAPEAPSAALPPAPGLDSLRRGHWRGAALVVAAAVLAAASIHWWTPTGALVPTPVASRQAPAVALAAAPREQAPVAPLTGRVAPVAPSPSSSDTATTAPAVVATAVPADAGAEAPAAGVAPVSAAAPPAPPRAAPRRAALARPQAPRAAMPRSAAPRSAVARSAVPRATPRPTTLKAAASRAALPRAPSVPSAKAVGTSGRPGLPQSPAATCSKAAQFSSCMRQLCAKPGNRAHTQCIQFRRKA